MRTLRPKGYARRLRAFCASVPLGACVACSLSPVEGEQRAREQLERVRSAYRPGDAIVKLPQLSASAKLEDLVRFAVLKHPRVEAAYYAWAAEVEAITEARSLPDPRLTFSADIGSMLESLMPGLMMDFPGPGKLAAAGAAAVESARGSYFEFERAVLRVAADLKNAYYRLHFLDDHLRVQRETLAILENLEQLAERQNAAASASLQDVLRAQIGKEEVRTQIANLEDSRNPLLAELKAALGLASDAPDPPIPAVFEPSPESAPEAAVLEVALARNPALQRMAAEVRRAERLLDLARKSGVPDFSVGLEADVKASPVMWTPAAGVSLPIWRDKIAAAIARAQAQQQAAEARLDAEQIALAAELAVMSFAVRESRRDLELLEQQLLPKGRRSLEVARASYAGNRAGFLDVLDAQRQLLQFETSRIEARTRRELALTAISLVIAGIPPEGAPLLPASRASGEPTSAAGQR